VADGQRIRLAGRGEAGERGGAPGDLYVQVRVRNDDLFGRSGDNLTITAPITYAEAVFGTDLRVPTMDGYVTLRVPPGTPNGRVLRARGRGVHKRDGQNGDLLVTVDVVVPTAMTDEAREALEKFAVLSPDAGRDALWDRR
jgi:molecular chaperone DnaJ